MLVGGGGEGGYSKWINGLMDNSMEDRELILGEGGDGWIQRVD